MYFIHKDRDRVKVYEWKKIYPINCKHKKTGMATLISDKTDFEKKSIT